MSMSTNGGNPLLQSPLMIIPSVKLPMTWKYSTATSDASFVFFEVLTSASRD